jgi:hypothetical protein
MQVSWIGTSAAVSYRSNADNPTQQQHSPAPQLHALLFPAITHVLCLRMEEWLAGGACDCSGCTAEAKSSAGRVGGAVQVVPELYPIFPRQGCLPKGALGGSRASQGLAFFFSFPTNTRLAWQAALSRAGLGPARLARLARQARQARLIPSSGTRAIPSSDGIGGTSCCLSCRAQG